MHGGWIFGAFVSATCLVNSVWAGEIGQPPSPSREIRPQYSPDGNRLAFNSDRAGVFDIYIMDLKSGEISQVTRHQGNNYVPRWSADATRLVFYSNYMGNPWAGNIEHDIYTINPDGSDKKAVVTGNSQDMFADWLPDGAGLVFVSSAGDPDAIYGKRALFTIDLESGLIGPLIADAPDMNVFQPSVHRPSGNIVFEGYGDGNSDIWLYDASLGEARQLTHTPFDEYGPTISPDGTEILFQAGHGAGGAHVMIMDMDGSNVRAVTHDGVNNTPSWGPDGSIVFVRMIPGSANPVETNWNIYGMNRDGSNLRLILDW